MYKNKYKILLKTKFYDILGPPSQTGFSNLLVYTHASTEGYLIDISLCLKRQKVSKKIGLGSLARFKVDMKQGKLKF